MKMSLMLLQKKYIAAQDALQEYINSSINKIIIQEKINTDVQFKYSMIKGIIDISALVDIFIINPQEIYQITENSYLELFKHDIIEVKTMKIYFIEEYLLNGKLNEYCNDTATSTEYINRCYGFLLKYKN